MDVNKNDVYRFPNETFADKLLLEFVTSGHNTEAFLL